MRCGYFLTAVVICAFISGLAVDWVAWNFTGISLAEHWWHSAVAGIVGGVIGIGVAGIDSGRRARNP